MDPASLCFQTSFSLCLLKCESQFHQFPVHSCKTEQMNPPWPMEPFIYWHIQSLLKDLLLCHEHWAIHHLSLLAHLLNPQPQCMIYIRPCDNPWSFGWQGIGIWLHIGFHVWALPQFAWKCGLTQDQCTLRPCCEIFHNFSLIDWLRKHVHIQVDCHPIIQGVVFPLCLLNQSCGRLQGFFWWTLEVLTTLLSSFNVLLLVFVFPFFSQHGGRQREFKTIEMQKIYSIVVLT